MPSELATRAAKKVLSVTPCMPRLREQQVAELIDKYANLPDLIAAIRAFLNSHVTYREGITLCCTCCHCGMAR